MRYFITSIPVMMVVLMLALGVTAKTQEVKRAIEGTPNHINVYVGIIDFNVNYERNIIKKTRSLSNLRLGLGYGMFYVSGEGTYLNAAFVKLYGTRNSYFEFNAGVKYMLTNSITNPRFSDQYIFDGFLGYRFMKPTGGLTFRAGLNYPAGINLGVGFKF